MIMIIGLTGGIASGKSTVSAYLAELGAIIIDADKIAHEIMEKGKPAYRKIIEAFGREILAANGEIDRSRLGKIVFNDREKKRLLEEITHPQIIKEMREKIEENRGQNKIIVLDVPLLFEAGLEKMVDESWLVYVDRETQLERLMARDGLSYQEANKRIKSQLSLEKKRELADFIIDNRGNLEELKREVFFKWREINEI
ncbi:MAG TPA: dephospho-CoA kinase [Halanaerobiales bacterium]|nr:dephospho-CoA kinase [Halanaerobiales bacterium]HPZ62727.1 dephospho-CoA kinase [Halanaerobiales bacterium]HQD04062.1 dephospho-CoA kinase [Halanaerobiales bacterium]